MDSTIDTDSNIDRNKMFRIYYTIIRKIKIDLEETLS